MNNSRVQCSDSNVGPRRAMASNRNEKDAVSRVAEKLGFKTLFMKIWKVFKLSVGSAYRLKSLFNTTVESV